MWFIIALSAITIFRKQISGRVTPFTKHPENPKTLYTHQEVQTDPIPKEDRGTQTVIDTQSIRDEFDELQRKVSLVVARSEITCSNKAIDEIQSVLKPLIFKEDPNASMADNVIIFRMPRVALMSFDWIIRANLLKRIAEVEYFLEDTTSSFSSKYIVLIRREESGMRTTRKFDASLEGWRRLIHSTRKTH